MKASASLFFCCIFSLAQLFAQFQTPAAGTTPMKKWQMSTIGGSIGLDNDHFRSMSLDELMVFAKNPEEMRTDLSGFEEDAYPIITGSVLMANIGFNPVDAASRTYRRDRELILGVGLHAGREAMITYKQEEMDTSIVYCNIQNEVNLTGSYIFKGTWGKRWHYYYGIGMNGGTTFNNAMLLITSDYFDDDHAPPTEEDDRTQVERFKAKSVLYSRVYVPYGIHYGFARSTWLIGLDFRTGIGIQKVHGEEANFISKTGAFTIGVRRSLH